MTFTVEDLMKWLKADPAIAQYLEQMVPYLAPIAAALKAQDPVTAMSWLRDRVEALIQHDYSGFYDPIALHATPEELVEMQKQATAKVAAAATHMLAWSDLAKRLGMAVVTLIAVMAV